MEILGLENALTEIKNSQVSLRSRLDSARKLIRGDRPGQNQRGGGGGKTGSLHLPPQVRVRRAVRCVRRGDLEVFSG